jgi:uncharacterized DUF497 family protein
MAFISTMPCWFFPILMPWSSRTELRAENFAGKPLVGGVVLLLVAHTARNQGEDEVIRIISARKASRKERVRYDQNRKKESL